MAVTVTIPQLFRDRTGGRDEVLVEAPTVGQVLDELDKKFPGIKGIMCNEDGSLRRHVNIYVNDEDVRFLSGLNTKLADGDAVTILPMIAGG